MHDRRCELAVRAWLDAILSVLLAPACVVCERPLERPTAGPVCPACWSSIPPLRGPLCQVCGDPLATWRQSGDWSRRCARCQATPRPVTCARAAGLYEGTLRTIVHALKYDGRRSLAPPLAGLMKARGEEVLDGAACVVPVPLHRARKRERGFNQAADLAAQLGLPMLDVLRRVRATAVQADLPAAKRQANVRDAFAVRGELADLRGRTVVLVDDVSTTGATLDACAVTLRVAGVADVRALTAARVVATPR